MSRSFEAARAGLIEWGVASRAFTGEAESGDRHVVQAFPEGVLVGVVDGLGHGAEAAAAARIAVDVLGRHARDSAIALARRCHEALLDSRGVVMSLASFSARDNTMTWLGIGNAAGVLVRAEAAASPAREVLLLRGGVVGFQLRQLSASVIPVSPGDVLVLATDGVRSDFVTEVTRTDEPQPMAEHILARYGKGTDDALVLVAEFVGGGP